MRRHDLLFIVLALAFPACASAPAAPAPSPVAPAVVAADDVAPRWAPNGLADLRWLGQGRHAFVGLLRMDPGARVPEHQDESEEYIYVLQGHGVLTMDGVPHTVRPGTFVLMPAGATVSYVNGDEEMLAVQVFADPTSAAKYERWSLERPPAGSAR